MSKVPSDLGKDAPLLQSKKLFGEMPTLEGSGNKSFRLSDQIDTIKDTAFKQGYEAGYESGSLSGQAEGRRAGFQKAMTDVNTARIIEVAVTHAHPARVTWERQWSPETTMNVSAGFDRIGTLQDAVEEAGRLGGIEGEPAVIRPPKKKTPVFDLLVETTAEQLGALSRADSGVSVDYRMGGTGW